MFPQQHLKIIGRELIDLENNFIFLDTQDKISGQGRAIKQAVHKLSELFIAVFNVIPEEEVEPIERIRMTFIHNKFKMLSDNIETFCPSSKETEA